MDVPDEESVVIRQGVMPSNLNMNIPATSVDHFSGRKREQGEKRREKRAGNPAPILHPGDRKAISQRSHKQSV